MAEHPPAQELSEAVQDGEVLDGDAQAAPEPPVTGDAAVDEVSANLSRLAGEPLEVHLEAFDAAHRTLQDRLADVDG